MDKIKRRPIFKLAIFGFLFCSIFFSSSAQASCPGEGLPGGFMFFSGLLVPCGMHNACGGTAGTQPCTLCHLLVLLSNIYNLLLSLLIIVALLFITIGGVMYIVSAGNPNLKSIAKKIITRTLTGFAIFLLSWLIVYTVLVFISANQSQLGTGGNWWEFTCNPS
jgi:hypothetical protein